MRDSQGNPTKRKAAVGDKVIVSHGYGGGACLGAGEVAIVTVASPDTFTMQCHCGRRFSVMQWDGYKFA